MRAERSVTRIDRGANQSEFVLCPWVRGFSDGCAAGRTRRSALPSSCNRPHSTGCFWLDAQRTKGRPVQVCSLPIGSGVFGWMPSGADTEVRPRDGQPTTPVPMRSRNAGPKTPPVDPTQDVVRMKPVTVSRGGEASPGL